MALITTAKRLFDTIQRCATQRKAPRCDHPNLQSLRFRKSLAEQLEERALLSIGGPIPDVDGLESLQTADAIYGTVLPRDVVNVAPPAPGLSLTETNGSTRPAEGVIDDWYDITLQSDPAGTVEITVTADAQTQVSVDGRNFAASQVLTFTSTDPQTITVRAVDDADAEGPHTSTITNVVTASDSPDYPLGMSADLTANVMDDEMPPVVGVDIDVEPLAKPTNWVAYMPQASTAVQTVPNLIRDDGAATDVSLTLQYDTGLATIGGTTGGITNTVPDHLPSLADVGGFRTSNVGLTATWSGLTVGADYGVYVLGLENTTGTFSQDVSITGATTFTQSLVDGQLMVNDLSSDGSLLGAFEVTGTADGSGQIVVHVTPASGSDGIAVAGLAIREIPDMSNDAPILTPIGALDVDEATELAFQATALDIDIPGDGLEYTLEAVDPAMASATLDSVTGDFSWTPTEEQGPGAYTFTIRVTDDGDGALSDSETVTVTVNEVNQAPVLGELIDWTVDELGTVSFQATATDANLPQNNLTYSLDSGAPAAAGITTDGLFTWVTEEADGPGAYDITVRVTDDGGGVLGALSDSQTITITVNEINLAPELVLIETQTGNELEELTFLAEATDPNLPLNTLTFSLENEPDGASITAGGAFSWTPTEEQGEDSYLITVRVTDNGAGAVGPLSDSQVVVVNVVEVNLDPVLAAIGNKIIETENLLAFTATATDADLDVALQGNTLTFSLGAGAPAAASITAGGDFTWTPGLGDAYAIHPITINVSDGTVTVSETIDVTVLEHNMAPVLDSIGPQIVNEGELLAFLATASDNNTPSDTLTFSLDSAPVGAAITTGGDFTWTPTEDQGEDSYLITIRVTDDNSLGNLFDTATFSVFVEEVNLEPELGSIGDKEVIALDTLTFTVTATDADLDTNSLPNVLKYSLAAGAPAAATIDPDSGVFSWTPAEADAYAIHAIEIIVTDRTDGSGMTDSEIINVTVREINLAPYFTSSIAPKVLDEGEAWTFTATAEDANDPLDTLTFSLGAGSPAGATIDGTTGVFNWTPAEDQQGPSTVTVLVTDNGADNGQTNLSASQNIAVIVNEINEPPVLPEIGPKTIDENVELLITATATDTDIPVDTLTYSLGAGAPATAVIDANGIFTWTPTTAEAGVDHLIEIIVSDGTVTDSEIITVTVVKLAGISGVKFEDLNGDGDQDAGEPGLVGKTITLNGSITTTTDANGAYSFTALQAGDYTVTETAEYGWIQINPNGGSYTLTLAEAETQAGLDFAGQHPVANVYALDASADGDVRDSNYDGNFTIVDATDTVVNTNLYVGTGSDEESRGIFEFDFTVIDISETVIFSRLDLTYDTLWADTTIQLNGAEGDNAITTGDATVAGYDLGSLAVTDASREVNFPVPAVLVQMVVGLAPASFRTTMPTYDDTFVRFASSEHADTSWRPQFLVETLSSPEIHGMQFNDFNRDGVQDADGADDILGNEDDEAALEGWTVNLDDGAGGVLSTVTDASGAYSFVGLSAGSYTLTGVLQGNSGHTSPAGGTYAIDLIPGQIVSGRDIGVHAPLVDPIGNQSGDELEQLTFTVTTYDPTNPVDFTATGLPGDATFIDGVFDWTPGEAEDGSYTVTITATDLDVPTQVTSETITVTVNEVNTAPTLVPITAEWTINEEETVSFQLSADDLDDLPANGISFSFSGLPFASASIDPVTNIFSWTPAEDEIENGVHVVTITATDDGVPAMTDEQDVTITVLEINDIPVMDPIGDQSVDEDTDWSLTIVADDRNDSPANIVDLTYTPLPAGATVTDGVLTWSPDESHVQDDSYVVTFTATDDGNPVESVSETITLTVNEVNDAPVFTDPVLEESVNEEEQLTFTLTADDSNDDASNQTIVTLSAASLPGTAGDATFVDGVFDWTPRESEQGEHLVTFTATDEGGATTDKIVTITVNEVNDAPVLDPIGDQPVDEDTHLSFTVTANDDNDDPNDGPANLIDIEVTQSDLPGGIFDASAGVFNWDPSELDDGVYTITFTATDHGTPPMSDSETVTITVNEVNDVPVLDPILDTDVDEEQHLEFTVTANDDNDDPGHRTAVTLEASPLSDTATFVDGLFTWDPLEDEDGEYVITFTATDGDGGVTTQDVTITVNEINEAPVFQELLDKTGDEDVLLEFTITADDPGDLPANTMTYTFVGDLPATAADALDPSSGVFSWTPSETETGLYTVTFTAMDDGSPNMSVDTTITITIGEVNDIPVFDPIDPQVVNEEETVTFTVFADDRNDDPPGVVTVVATTMPATADFTDGLFTWTPGEADQGDHTVTFTATDDGGAFATKDVVITVLEINDEPGLTPIGPQTIAEGSELRFDFIGNDDADIPANGLTLSYTALPAGAEIIGDEFVWTPGETQEGEHVITFTVTDDGVEPLSVEETVTITVTEVNEAPVLAPVVDDWSIFEETPLLIELRATDPNDSPPNDITYRATGMPVGAILDQTSGDFTWTPAEDQARTEPYEITFFADDNGSPVLSDSVVVSVTVYEINDAPVVQVGNQSGNEEELLTFPVIAGDINDIPANNVDVVVTGLPSGADITDGVFTWTPTEDEDGTYVMTITATDDGLPPKSDSETFTITVNEVNDPPVLDPIGDQTAAEGALLSFTVTANDDNDDVRNRTENVDILLEATGMPATATFVDGLFNWTPDPADAGAEIQVTFTATDTGNPPESVSETITITVAGAPVVEGVFFSGSLWRSGFLVELDAQGLGHATIANLGFSPVAAGDQLTVMSWTQVDQVTVVFDRDVTVETDDLAIFGVNTASYAATSVAYDPTTFVATWTIEAPLAVDKLIVTLDSDAATGVRSVTGNVALDGEWTNPTAIGSGDGAAFPSGDGTSGGDFAYRANMLPGNVNGDTRVTFSDFFMIRSQLNQRPGLPGYEIEHDLNGDGRITFSDAFASRAQLNQRLPSAEPTVPAAPAAPSVQLVFADQDDSNESTALSSATQSVMQLWQENADEALEGTSANAEVDAIIADDLYDLADDVELISTPSGSAVDSVLGDAEEGLGDIL